MTEDQPRARTKQPEPPAYEPVAPDPVELELLRQIEGGRAGLITPEDTP